MRRRVLITGAGARLGQVLACELAQDNWHVLVHFRNSEAGANATLQQIRDAGGTGELVQADLADPGACRDLLPQINARSGSVQALINNASLFEPDEIGSLQHELWAAHFAINTEAPVMLGQALAEQLPNNETGHIINLLDQRLARPNPQFLSYTLSKAALHKATMTMAQALAPAIQVNAVSPGPCMRNARQSIDDFTRQVVATPLATGSPPMEIAKAVLYLLQSKAVTGQNLIVDGGQHLIWQGPDNTGIAE